MAKSALKKGEPRFTLFKAIPSGIKWNIQTVTEITGKFRKVQLLPWRVCKLQGTTTDETFKKQERFYACILTSQFSAEYSQRGLVQNK